MGSKTDDMVGVILYIGVVFCLSWEYPWSITYGTTDKNGRSIENRLTGGISERKNLFLADIERNICFVIIYDK